MFLWAFLVFTIINFKNVYATVSICSTEECPSLRSYGIKCHKFENNIDCLTSISKNETQLGYALPYQAITATKFIPNLEIIGQITKTEDSSEWEFEIVVLTNRDVTNFRQLKNFNYYNWGFGDPKIPNFVVDKLEKKLYKTDNSQRCLKKTTLAEKQVCELNEFFGPSCRAGSWTYVSDKDEEMKMEYRKLCQVCDLPETCSLLFNAMGLASNEPVVAVTYLDEVPHLNHIRYLCPNGTTTRKPCVWYQQPYPLIYTHKGSKHGVAPKLNQLFSVCSKNQIGDCKGIFGNAFASPAHLSVLNKNKANSIVPTLQNYEANLDDKPLKWCTISELETKKCNWLKFFSPHLIYPIDCIQKASKSECVQAIENYEADLVQITNIPIKKTLIPIAISTTPNKLIDLSTLKTKNCFHKYTLNEEDNVFNVDEDCPNGQYQVLCNETTCTYLTEIIMRTDDPNKENAQNFIGNLKLNFLIANETRPFEFFGKFDGVPDLLISSNANLTIVEVKYEETTQYVNEMNYSPNYATSYTSRLWVYIIIVVVVKIIMIAIAGVVRYRRKTVLISYRSMQNEQI